MLGPWVRILNDLTQRSRVDEEFVSIVLVMAYKPPTQGRARTVYSCGREVSCGDAATNCTAFYKSFL